jgi:hypothetical protein
MGRRCPGKNTYGQFADQEVGQRIEETKKWLEGREIRHGEYFEHLDMLINRIQRVDQEQKDKTDGRKKSVTDQQSARRRGRN